MFNVTFDALIRILRGPSMADTHRSRVQTREVRESIHCAERFGAQADCKEEFERLFARYSAYRQRLSFPSEDRNGRCDLFGIAPGMLMLVVDVAPKRAFHARLRGQDLVEFHFRLSGSLSLTGRWGEVSMGDSPSLLLWYQPVGCDDVAEQLGVRTDARERWVSLYCDTEWLRETGTGSRELLRSLRQVSTADAPRYRLLADMGDRADLIRDIVQNPYEGAERDSYARSRGLQLLGDAVRCLSNDAPQASGTRRLTPRDCRGVAQARNILSREFVDPPDLSTLARRVGLSTTKLCAGFMSVFGEPTSAYVRRRRLERAHALLARSAMPVNQIATHVGYRHHSTFTAAYSRHFGRPPRQVRKGQCD
jgi:AraC-like DNA-binding protein